VKLKFIDVITGLIYKAAVSYIWNVIVIKIYKLIFRIL